VLVELASGEQVDVPRDELELVWPPHPCRAERDPSSAQWVVDAADDWIRTGNMTVGAFVPPTFERVTRVLHPWADVESWREVAGRNGFVDIGALADARNDNDEFPVDALPPNEGRVDTTTMGALIDALAPATLTPDDVMFLVWEGWGGTPWERFAQAATVELPGRTCRFVRGPIEGALVPINLAPFMSDTLAPMVWWPADRAWFVHSEIDWMWTFVAGSAELVEALEREPALETVRSGFDAVANRLEDG
jgi:hypothetical protein